MLYNLLVLSTCILVRTTQVVPGLLDPCNYRILHDEEGIGNGAYDYHAEQCRSMYLKILGVNNNFYITKNLKSLFIEFYNDE